MTDPPTPPEDDPLWAEIQDIAAGLDHETLRPDLSDPALLELVDRAVSPYEHVLTPEGLEEARRMATFALATHPDIEPVLERVRARLAKQASEVRPTRSAEELDALARRRGKARR